MENLFNSTNMHSTEESELEDYRLDYTITRAEVAWAVKNLCSGSTPGMDEIRLKLLKAPDSVGLSWLTHLCNIVWTLGTLPLEWHKGVVVPLFKTGD